MLHLIRAGARYYRRRLGQVNLPSSGTDLTRGFLITFTCEQFEPKDLLLIFGLDNGTQFQITGAQLASYYLQNEGNANRAEKAFFEHLQTPGYDRVLEIG